MGQTKIVLSPTELELVTNAGWILTKNGIIQKVYELFGQLSEKYRDIIADAALSQDDIGIRSPKISKGELYEGLPWVMLDYPRNYSGEDALGIRCFFWWGNFCSITFYLSGKYQQKYAGGVQHYIQEHPADWFVGIGTDPWKHHFRKDNYIPAGEWTHDMDEVPFIKLAKKISLHDWEKLDAFFEENYRVLVAMVTK